MICRQKLEHLYVRAKCNVTLKNGFQEQEEIIKLLFLEGTPITVSLVPFSHPRFHSREAL